MTTPTATMPTPATDSPRVSALVCVPPPEQQDFLALEVEIKLRQAQVVQLEEELAPLDAALDKFEWEYRAQLGGLQRELRDLNSLIERLEHRTVRIHARLVADPDGMLGDLFTRDELNEIGEMFGIEIPASWFAAEDAARERERERAWRFHQSTNQQDTGEEEFLRNAQSRQQRQLPEAERKECRTLYLALARGCHPDLATDDADRSRREDLMLRINAAWQAQDIDALRRIEQDRAGTLGWRALTNWAERVLWAHRECARLDDRIVDLTERLRTLRTNDTYPLWFNPALGSSVISQRAVSLRIDIANAHHRVDEAREAFRQALHHYAAAVA